MAAAARMVPPRPAPGAPDPVARVRGEAAGVGLTLLAAAGFGTVSVTSRLAAADGLDTFGYIWWRAATGFVLLLILVAFMARTGMVAIPSPRAIPSRQRWLLLAATLVNLGLNAAVLLGIARTSVTLGMLVFYTWPAMITVAANRLQGEPLDRRRLAALGLASAGLVLVILAPVLAGDGSMTIDPVGIALVLAAAVGQTIYTLIAVRGFSAVPPVAAYTVLVGVAIPGNLLLALCFGAAWQIGVPLADPSLLTWALVGGILGSAIPGAAVMTGVRRLGATRSSILMMLEPVAALAYAWLLLGERLTPVQLVGGAMVIAAGMLLQLPTRPGGVGGVSPRAMRRGRPASG